MALVKSCVGLTVSALNVGRHGSPQAEAMGASARKAMMVKSRGVFMVVT